MYAINQVIPTDSNGGVDVVAPGFGVLVIDSINDLYVDTGSSFATPHVSGLIALQLEYARKKKIEYNNDYHWEVMKHGAVDLGYFPIDQGKGKIYAAGTPQAFAIALSYLRDTLEDRLASQSGYGFAQSGYGRRPVLDIPQWDELLSEEGIWMSNNTSDSLDIGSIDLMVASWPIVYTFEYPFSFTEDDDDNGEEGYPAFYIGGAFYQNTTLFNVTDLIGNEEHTIEGLDITTTQRYAGTGEMLPGYSQEDFSSIEPITLEVDSYLSLLDGYRIPITTRLGTYRTELDLEFNLEGNSRFFDITNSNASIWCASASLLYSAIPGDLNIDNMFDEIDLLIFMKQW